ncbi:MAG: DUF401 family protein [Ignisphaera sp.]|nr:DUF401 family protein [Ignisphaera sp.]
MGTNPLYSFLASLAIVVVGVALGIQPALVVLASLTLFSLLVFGHSFLIVWAESININMLSTVSALVLSMYLAELYRGSVASKRSVEALESISPGLASLAIPALVGLLPMPGGAYVSATIVDEVYTRCGLREEEKTYLNFWFRHIWITVWPLYQGVLIASYILGMSIDEIVSITWPVMVGSITAGLATSWRRLLRCRGDRDTDLRGLIHLWPFAVIAVLNLGLKLNVAIAVALTIAAFTLIYKPSIDRHWNALKYSLKPSILALIIASLIYGYALSRSGVAEEIASIVGVPQIASYVIPFLVVLATGFEFTFSAIALPVLKNLIDNTNLFLVFLGGFSGSMLSPVHACLVLSAQYYKANLRKVYKYLIPSTILALLTSIALHILVMKI